MWTIPRVANHLSIDHDTAAKVIAIVREQAKPDEVPATAAWIQQCFHRPSESELKMHALNSILGLFGSEPIWGGGSITRPAAEYLNTGDTYGATIVLDYVAGRFRLSTMGDFVERFERRYGLR